MREIDYLDKTYPNGEGKRLLCYASLVVTGVSSLLLWMMKSDDKDIKELSAIAACSLVVIFLCCVGCECYKNNRKNRTNIAENKNSIFHNKNENEKTDDSSIHDEENQKNIANLRVPSYGNLT